MKISLTVLLIALFLNTVSTQSKSIVSGSDSIAIAYDNTMPLQKSQTNSAIGIWNAQMLIGNGFNFDRGIGFGVRGNFEFPTNTFGGISIFYHMGFPRSITVDGYGPSVYWGPEIGQRFDFTHFKIEVLCNAGEITYEEAPEYTPHFAQGTVSKFYYAPGIGMVTRTATGSVGVHARYVVVPLYSMLGLYFSLGI